VKEREEGERERASQLRFCASLLLSHFLSFEFNVDADISLFWIEDGADIRRKNCSRNQKLRSPCPLFSFSSRFRDASFLPPFRNDLDLLPPSLLPPSSLLDRLSPSGLWPLLAHTSIRSNPTSLSTGSLLRLQSRLARPSRLAQTGLEGSTQALFGSLETVKGKEWRR